jgi:hypothetical protein
MAHQSDAAVLDTQVFAYHLRVPERMRLNANVLASADCQSLYAAHKARELIGYVIWKLHLIPGFGNL